MLLVPITDRFLEKKFLEVPLLIYKDDPNFIRPLDKDINDVFNPKKNKAFRFGECTRWLLRDENEDRFIGRVAAFVNKKYKNKGDTQKTGGIGFFECINNQEAADMLFDVAKAWLMQRGMEAMDGPINFGERDRWWGLVVEGFKPPIYLMNYNPPYYVELFEKYGFKNFFNQVCWELPVSTELNERFNEMNKKYSALPDYSASHIKKNNMQKFANDFCLVYNKAWASHEGNKQLSNEVAMKMFKAMKPAMDERLIWFTYYKDEPIAFWINLPELNQIFRRFNGKFGLLEKLRFLWLKKRGVNNKFTGIVFGVAPRFQGKGIDYFMISEAAKVIQHQSDYNQLELQWQGDFNPKMLNISRNLGAHQSRMLTTYRYLFDRTKEFHRHPVLN
jgi:GNAT superfamily N-acetyltransferase